MMRLYHKMLVGILAVLGLVLVAAIVVEPTEGVREAPKPEIMHVPITCMVDGADCVTVRDERVGVCRYMDFDVRPHGAATISSYEGNSSGTVKPIHGVREPHVTGRIETLMCDKDGLRYELYRRYVSHDLSHYRICANGNCIEPNKGFVSFTTAQIPPAEENYLYRGIEGFDVHCEIESGCTLVRDDRIGECRYVGFSTSHGDIEVLGCHREDSRYEFYRRSAPDVDFRACMGPMCVDRRRGFDSHVLAGFEIP